MAVSKRLSKNSCLSSERGIYYPIGRTISNETAYVKPIFGLCHF